MKQTIGFAVTGSFCSIDKIYEPLKNLCEEFEVLPIVSFNVYNLDNRFSTSTQTISILEQITGNKVIKSITEAEPIGPKKLLDLLIIAPCTGNTLAKIACGISDTPVTLSFKSHLRNARPALIGVSTNDGLTANAKNIGTLMNTKNVFFVPLSQDDAHKKSSSLICDFTQIKKAALAALDKTQLQPLLI